MGIWWQRGTSVEVRREVFKTAAMRDDVIDVVDGMDMEARQQ